MSENKKQLAVRLPWRYIYSIPCFLVALMSPFLIIVAMHSLPGDGGKAVVSIGFLGLILIVAAWCFVRLNTTRLEGGEIVWLQLFGIKRLKLSDIDYCKSISGGRISIVGGGSSVVIPAPAEAFIKALKGCGVLFVD